MGKPEIRFKGYTDEWEQRKLGEVTQCLDSERVPINSEEREKIPGEIPYYGAGNIQGYINKFLFDEELVLLLEDGDAFDDFRTKEIAQYICGKTWVNNHAHVLRPLGDAYFLYVTLSHKDIRNWVQLAGASRKKLVQKSMLNIELFMPHIIEQKKIGQYFSNLDHLITLHQRKCDEVKSLKKYMLQKMFPQNEQKVPEIRFEGFTEAWEQRKLGDLVDRVTRKNQDLVSELPLTISAQYGLIDQNEFFDKRVASKDVSGYYLIENGEFAYNKSTSTDAPWGAIKRLDRYENGVLSTLYIVFGIKENNPVDSDFLVSYYNTNLWHKGIHEIAAEGARNHGLLNIAPADFFETKLMIPQDIEEQKKIGKYFEELERLITLHQQKCEELKKIKKFMLQKMFV